MPMGYNLQAFMAATDEIDQGLDLCAETNAAGNCTLLNQQVFTR